MIFLEPVRDGLLDMWAYKARTILQTLGVLLGAASVIVTIALLAGGKEENKDFIETTGGVTTLEVRKNDSGRLSLFARDQSPFGVTLQDLQAVRREVEPLGALVYAARNTVAEVATPDSHQTNVGVWGVTPEYAQIQHLFVEEGRYLSSTDVDYAQPVAVLGSRLKEKLFGNGPAVGKEVLLRSADEKGPDPRRYRVVGVLEQKVYRRSEEDDENWLAWMNDLAYVPVSALLARETGGRDLTFLGVRAPDLASIPLVEARLETALLHAHHGARNFRIFDRSERLQEWNDAGIMYDAAIGGAGAISLLVGGIVIMNILLASLRQRIREVGIRKALGARNLEIFLQFLTESVIVAGLGGLGGALVGSSVSGLVSRLLEQKLMLSGGTITLGVGISVGVGLLFGIYPAIKAARLDPVAALRYE